MSSDLLFLVLTLFSSYPKAWGQALSLSTCASIAQDLVSKNEALRRQLHELQLHTEQQLRRKDAAAQAEDERRSQTYQKAMDEAKQLNAELKVGNLILSSLCHSTPPSMHIWLKQSMFDTYHLCPVIQGMSACVSMYACVSIWSTTKHMLHADVNTANDAAA